MGKGRLWGLRLLLGLALVFSLVPIADAEPAGQPLSDEDGTASTSDDSRTFRVYAHREGLVGHTTANGHVIVENDRFVALPCFCVLSSKGGDEFQVRIEYKGKSVVVPVWDVGPWNVDDNYWDPPSERRWPGLEQGVPQAAAAFFDDYNDGRDGRGREVRSAAGIDIADGTFWHDLGMTDSDWVDVTFLWLDEKPEPELPPLPEGYEDIPTVAFSKRPPLDPVEPKDPDAYLYIPETGHNIPTPLVDYWYANGGWRNLGLPITELFRVYYDNGSWRLVQYFERAILELHIPAGEHGEVTADLIGYSVSTPQAARAPITPFENNDHHWYFPETGHSLSHGFKDHWVKYGGLSAFGYPITEEYSATNADGRTYVAQVFERARFEWWPDKVGTDEEITHGLLVVDLLRKSGW